MRSMNDDSFSKYNYSSAVTFTSSNSVSAWYSFVKKDPEDQELIFQCYVVEKRVIFKHFGRLLKKFKDTAFKAFHLSIPIFKRLSISITITVIYPKKDKEES